CARAGAPARAAPADEPRAEGRRGGQDDRCGVETPVALPAILSAGDAGRGAGDRALPGAGLRHGQVHRVGTDADLGVRRRGSAPAVVLEHRPERVDQVVEAVPDLLDLEATGHLAAPA